jgi:hypothetical protein
LPGSASFSNTVPEGLLSLLGMAKGEHRKEAIVFFYLIGWRRLSFLIGDYNAILRK